MDDMKVFECLDGIQKQLEILKKLFYNEINLARTSIDREINESANNGYLKGWSDENNQEYMERYRKSINGLEEELKKVKESTGLILRDIEANLTLP